MKYGVFGVADISIYDENGKLVTVLDTLQHTVINNEKGFFVIIKDALLDSNLLRFANNQLDVGLCDFDRQMASIKGTPIKINGKRNGIKCKLVLKNTIRRRDDGEDIEMIQVFENALFEQNIDIELANDEVTSIDSVFKIMPMSDDGDVCEIYGL